MRDVEKLVDCQFGTKFRCTQLNGYKQLLEDEHINMSAEKKDDNLAYANMDLINVP